MNTVGIESDSMSSAVYISPAVYAQAFKAAERFAVSRGLDLDAFRKEQASGDAIVDDDEDRLPAAPASAFAPDSAGLVREWDVALGEHGEHIYRIASALRGDAVKAARKAHNAAGLKSSNRWRIRCADKKAIPS